MMVDKIEYIDKGIMLENISDRKEEQSYFNFATFKKRRNYLETLKINFLQ